MIQADKTVLVTGATGRQGGAVIRHIMLPKGWKLRALDRHVLVSFTALGNSLVNLRWHKSSHNRLRSCLASGQILLIRLSILGNGYQR